jgi:transcription elongation factor GreA
MITNAMIIEDGPASDRVRLGSKVTVTDQEGVEEHYTIVGSIEANPAEGKISNESPVGQALLGRKAGEAVQVLVPAGALKLKIVSID